MKRILKSEKYLGKLLAPNDNFYVGILFEDVIKTENSTKYGIGKTFKEDQEITPNPVKSATKQNLKGKFVRKYPEEKTTKRVHISYDRKVDGAHIEYDRDFNVYVKVLSHQFKMKFAAVINKHGERLLVSPLLVFDNVQETNTKNAHAINLFLEIFGEFEIYTSELEPALAFTDKYEFDVLPKGKFEEGDIEEYVEGARRFLKTDEEIRAYQKRLQVLKNYDPEIIGRGPSVFLGYIVFGFKKLGVVLLESMYSGNATYVFDIENYQSLCQKQTRCHKQ